MYESVAARSPEFDLVRMHERMLATYPLHPALALDRWERDLNALASGCFEVYLREKDEAVREACLEIIEMCRPGWKDRYTARAAQMRMQFATASADGGDGSDDE